VSENQLMYAWPDSPMRLMVDVDPARAEGPVAIEVVSDRAIALPPDSHAVFGTVFRQVRR
jgi:hypothetical protein